jgi:hypothetical protein
MRQAAQAIGVTRGTLHNYIKAGRVRVNPDGTIQVAELLRAGFIIRSQRGQQENIGENTRKNATSEKVALGIIYTVFAIPLLFFLILFVSYLYKVGKMLPGGTFLVSTDVRKTS